VQLECRCRCRYSCRLAIVGSVVAISGKSRLWTVKGLDEVRIGHDVVSSVMERHKLSRAVAACLRVRTCLVLASNAAQFWKERASDAGWMRCNH
jgi:hypothetical protein